MSGSGVLTVLVLIVVVTSIAYVWKRVMSEPGTMSDGTPGSVMDGNEEVRRIDLGTHAYVAQRSQEQLTEEGYTCRVVTLESGAFGIGMGDHQYLVYNADDEPRVRQVVNALLEEVNGPADESGYDDADYQADYDESDVVDTSDADL